MPGPSRRASAWKLEHLPAGRYELTAFKEDLRSFRRREPGDLSLDRGYSDVLPLDESGRSDVVIRLAPDGSVSGTVVGPDGNPVEGARVSVSQEVTIANTSGAAQAGRSH